MVVVSIGGNDFNFASIVQSCVTDFLTSPSWFPDYCKDDSRSPPTSRAANVTAVRARIATAFQNVRTAMRNAGYGDNSWTLLVQNYPSPIPAGAGSGTAQSGFTRQSIGGCGFWNSDADWANSTALNTINTTVRRRDGPVRPDQHRDRSNLQSAFNGRRLCENTVGLRGVGLTPGPSRARSTRPSGSTRSAPSRRRLRDYYIQESLHPNYWAQLALRSLRPPGLQRRHAPRRHLHHRRPRPANGEPRMTLN